MEIKFYSRIEKKLKVEKVYGDILVRFFYQNALARPLHFIFWGPLFSKLCGFWQDQSWSRLKIKEFVKNYQIPMQDYLPQEGHSPAEPYANFNQFFVRRFVPGKRNFTEQQNLMPGFVEARYFGHAAPSSHIHFPVKGQFLTAQELLVNTPWAKDFVEGPILIARLCPVDYHRYHFPDDGTILGHYRIPGQFHSVNPLALKKLPQIFITNERQVTILQTKNFGKLAYIEVGAMGVGKIIQSYKNLNFKRGDEKGYFLFGASTVIVLGEKNRWIPSD
ncbi:MAG: phosphatidylserine decarboxylase, partial [Pseudomonadota bacterium]